MKLTWPTYIKMCFGFDIRFIDKVRLCFKPCDIAYDIVNGNIVVRKHQDGKIFIVRGLK